MKAVELEKNLVGKKIKKVVYTSYMDRGMCIDRIVFEDGSVLELEGHCDFAAVSGYYPDGESGERYQVDNPEADLEL